MPVKFDMLNEIGQTYKKGVEGEVKKATQGSESTSGETTPEGETLPLL
jgi:hypothetical protein